MDVGVLVLDVSDKMWGNEMLGRCMSSLSALLVQNFQKNIFTLKKKK